jgi:hypothetical protein
MSRADASFERLSDWFARLSEKARDRGGLLAKAAPLLADDAEFVRKLRPSLIRARARGELPAESASTEPRPAPRTQLRPAPGEAASTNSRPGHSRKGGSPIVVIVGAAAAGVALARLLDWSGHAHPRG